MRMAGKYSWDKGHKERILLDSPDKQVAWNMVDTPALEAGIPVADRVS